MFFINGVYWKEDDRHTLKTLSPSAPNTIPPRTLKQYTFHGFIGKEKMEQVPEHVTDGFMFDGLGESELFEFKFDGDNLSFKTGDMGGNSEILFRFKRSNDGAFIGEWEVLDPSGLLIDNDSARCMLTEIPNYFFTKPE